MLQHGGSQRTMTKKQVPIYLEKIVSRKKFIIAPPPSCRVQYPGKVRGKHSVIQHSFFIASPLLIQNGSPTKRAGPSGHLLDLLWTLFSSRHFGSTPLPASSCASSATSKYL